MTIVVAEELESVLEADEDSEALVEPDREPLTSAHWEQVERWLAQSRQDLLRLLSTLPDEQLEWRPEGRTRNPARRGDPRRLRRADVRSVDVRPSLARRTRRVPQLDAKYLPATDAVALRA
jgi:hypothetical protein